MLLKELPSEQRKIRKDLGYLLNSMLSSSINVYLIILTVFALNAMHSIKNLIFFKLTRIDNRLAFLNLTQYQA